MNKRKLLLTFCAALCFCTLTAQRTITDFDSGWRFFREDTAQAEGAERASFNDSQWRLLDVPHDWSVEKPLNQEYKTGRGGGYADAGTAWYRKTFDVDSRMKDKQVFVEFDGVMANSKIWVNGEYLGGWPYGYTSFRLDMTPLLKFGQENVIAVHVDNQGQPASRWYTGGGIYRHVRLVAVDPVHIDHWGVFVTTPEVSREQATVKVTTTVVNESPKSSTFQLATELRNESKENVGTAATEVTLAAGESKDVEQFITVSYPQLWDVESPFLYRAYSTLSAGGKTFDNTLNTFGIRTIEYKAESGFWLNGKNIKFYGVCLHQDAAALGVAVPLSVWEERLLRLRNLGTNAVRTAHNPMDPGFYDLCDRLGFLVMDESFDAWVGGKNPYDYHLYFKEWWDRDLAAMVKRDRNHPCVVIYSVGNEIRDDQKVPGDVGFTYYKKQQDLIHSLDPTRPVTMALFRPNTQGVYENGFADMMDVVGQNYREPELIAAHKQNPNRIVTGTENGHGLTQWLALRDNPFMTGQFLWAGIDYFGEADWPKTYSSQGVVFRSGEFKTRSYQRQAYWSPTPVISIARVENVDREVGSVDNWTPRSTERPEAYVQVYTNCDEAELFLNDKSLGTQKKNANDSPLTWRMPYEKGVIRAVGKNEGRVVAAFEMRSAEKPKALKIHTDKPALANDFEDATHIRVSLVDENGTLCPNNDRTVTFEIEGDGKLLAVYNDDVYSHEFYQGTEYPSFLGKAYAVVRAVKDSGSIKVTARAEGLEPASVVLNILPPKAKY